MLSELSGQTLLQSRLDHTRQHAIRTGQRRSSVNLSEDPFQGPRSLQLLSDLPLTSTLLIFAATTHHIHTHSLTSSRLRPHPSHKQSDTLGSGAFCCQKDDSAPPILTAQAPLPPRLQPHDPQHLGPGRPSAARAVHHPRVTGTVTLSGPAPRASYGPQNRAAGSYGPWISLP